MRCDSGARVVPGLFRCGIEPRAGRWSVGSSSHTGEVVAAAPLDTVEVGKRFLDVAPALLQLVAAGGDLVEQVPQLSCLPRLFVVHVHDPGDLVEREPEAFAAQDEREPDPVAVPEDPLRAAPLGGEQAEVLVVANRAEGDVVVTGQLRDAPRLLV